MAEAAAPELFSEQELTCSICLDLFDEPVSTPCGHNFCQVRTWGGPEGALRWTSDLRRP